MITKSVPANHRLFNLRNGSRFEEGGRPRKQDKILATFTYCSSAYNTLAPILFHPLIPPLPIHLVDQFLAASLSPNVLPEHLKRALRIRITAPTNMGRDEAIRRIP
jgi:hypothetical protein